MGTIERPVLKLKWLKLVLPDRLEYPSKKVDSPEGCGCDHFTHDGGDRRAGVHWHYEDDLAAKPKRHKQSPIYVEDRGGGDLCQWSFGMWGPIGSVGRYDGSRGPLQPLSTKRDFEEAAKIEARLDDPRHKMQHFATRLSNGRVRVQNILMGLRGQEHEHLAAGFAKWSKGIDPRCLHVEDEKR